MTDRSDFNDLAQSTAPGDGVEAVRRILGAAFEQAKELKPAAPTKPHANPPGTLQGGQSAPDADADSPSPTAPAGDEFELRRDGIAPGVWRLKWEPRKGGGFECVEQFVCAPLERAAIMEFDARMSRPAAESAAALDTLARIEAAGPSCLAPLTARSDAESR